MPAMNPNLSQAQQLQALGAWNQIQPQGVTPLAGAGPGAGRATALATLAQALIAKQKKKNWQAQYGIAPPTPQGTAAAAQSPASSAPTGGASGSTESDDGE